MSSAKRDIEEQIGLNRSDEPATVYDLLKAANEAHDDMPAVWLCMLVKRLARELKDELLLEG